jgi:NTE family protein
MDQKKLALVLGGGGARGAYQVGILKSWLPILQKNPRIHILSGASVGSINAVELCQHAEDLPKAVAKLYDLWTHLKPSAIFETEIKGMVKNILHIAGIGQNESPIASEKKGQGLLNPEPLHQLLRQNIDMDKVHRNLQSFPGSALVINSFNYSAMKNVSMYQSTETVSGWEKADRKGIDTTLTLEHIFASCAIPFVFPTINLNGEHHGDGSLRSMTPLNPAIKMGADRIIGISLKGSPSRPYTQKAPSLSAVASVVFESMFIDSMSHDANMIHRINSLINSSPTKKVSHAKPIELCHIASQTKFGEIAESYRHRFPKNLNRVFGGWISSDFLSFLLFDGQYAEALIDQGYKDGLKYLEQVEPWFLETLTGK